MAEGKTYRKWNRFPFKFYADPPIDISEEKRQRICHSFSEQGFCLNNIYKLHAAEEYCSRETRLKECFQKGKKGTSC